MKKYEELKFEIVFFTEDVVTASEQEIEVGDFFSNDNKKDGVAY